MLNTKDLISYVVLPKTVKDLLDRLESGRLSDVVGYVSNSNGNCLNSTNDKTSPNYSEIQKSTSTSKSIKHRHKFPFLNNYKSGILPKFAGESRRKETNKFRYTHQHSHYYHPFHYTKAVRDEVKYNQKSSSNLLKQKVNNFHNCHNLQNQQEFAKNSFIPYDNKPNEHGNHIITDGVNANSDLNVAIQNEQEKCVSCGKCFLSKVLLIEHYLTHSLSECVVCGKKSPDKWKLKRHLNTHVREKPLKGSASNKTAPKDPDLPKEKKSSTAEGPYECRQCRRIFSERINFKNHLKRHFLENLHTSSPPGKAFSVKSYHINHFNTFRVHKCKVCSKTFPDKWKLQRHFEAHTGKKLHGCKMCNKKFFYKWQLTRHIPSHTFENPQMVVVSTENNNG